LTGERVGRRTRWRLTDAGNAVMAEGRDRVLAMGGPQPPWDGSWLIVHVTVPTASRAVRPTLYGALRWYGFGNPTPGLWLSPHRQHVDAVARLVHRLDLARTTLSFVGGSASIGLSDAELVSRSWDLDGLRAYYADLLGRFRRRRPRRDDEILLDHLDLITAWQRIPFVDPQLPEELLPNWIGRRTVARFAELRDHWYDRAAARWRELVAEGD
jgi:phenylacetic acid degradation operon negative regulatory protein